MNIGDRVTWRQGKTKVKADGSRIIPIGIANCRVVEFGEIDGEPCARLAHWLFHKDAGLVPAMLEGDIQEGMAWAKVSDLETE